MTKEIFTLCSSFYRIAKGIKILFQHISNLSTVLHRPTYKPIKSSNNSKDLKNLLEIVKCFF